MFVNTDESLASFLGVWEPGIRWKTSKIWRSQKSQTLCTLGWIRGSYFCLTDTIGAACVFSLQISVLVISPLHGFSRGVTGPGHSTAVCRLLQHGLGVHWCLSYWRPWTQVRCCSTLLTGWLLMSCQHIVWGNHTHCYTMVGQCPL